MWRYSQYGGSFSHLKRFVSLDKVSSISNFSTCVGGNGNAAVTLTMLTGRGRGAACLTSLTKPRGYGGASHWPASQHACRNTRTIEISTPANSYNTYRNVQSLHHTCHRQFHLVSKHVERQIFEIQNIELHGKELRAFSSLLSRSGFTSLQEVVRICANGGRPFSTSRASYQQHQQPDQDEERDPNKPPDDEKMPFVARLMLVLWTTLMAYLISRVLLTDDSSDIPANRKFVSWNEFVHEMLAKGEVEDIIFNAQTEFATINLFSGAVVKGQKVDSRTCYLKVPEPTKFEERIRELESSMGIPADKAVPIAYTRQNEWTPVIYMLILGAVAFVVFRNLVKFSLPSATDLFASERKAKFVRVDLLSQSGKGINFHEVAGLHEAKIEVMEFVDYLKKPSRYKVLGAKIPKGALLLGPPGCGKTLLAKAVATEAKVPFLAMAGSEFVEMLGGLGASRVRSLFKQARENAPCIIYIDEIDAIGRKRGGDNWSEASSEEEHTLNQLLVEMDGMSTTDDIIIIASTNRSSVLDKALLRPGRFDRHILIDLPTLAERKEIFELYLKKLKLAQPPINHSEKLSHLSPGMSGADINNICNEAALHAARDKKTKVESSDFDYAVERVVAGVAKKSRVMSVQEMKIVAYHEAGHALLGWLLQHTDALLRVSIVPRTNQALGFAQYMPSDRKLHSKEELFERMCMALGGRVAESLTFNSVTTGAQDDLRQVTRLAYDQIRVLGMNERIGTVSFPNQADGQAFGSKPYSKQTARLIDEEARLLVARAYKTAEKLLSSNKEKLRVVAEALLETETLTYKEMEELIGPPPFGKKNMIDFSLGTATPSAV